MNGRFMKTLKTICLVSIAAFALSCSKSAQENAPASNSEFDPVSTVSLSASSASSLSKTYLNENFQTRWSDGDVLAVFDGHKREFAMVENNGATATFQGVANTEVSSYAVVYPCENAVSDDGEGHLTVNIPSEQVIASGQVVANGALVAVDALTSLSDGVSFNHVVGLVKVTLGEGISYVKLTGANQEGIAGNVVVNAADGSLAGTPSESTVLIRPASGTFAAGDYYIAVAPVTLSNGFTLTLCNQYNARATRTGANALVIPQNGGKDLGNITTGLAWPSGLPCGWNFYAEGYTSTTESLEALKATENGQHWLNDGYLLPTAGVNPDARLTAVTTKAEADIQRSFNPSIQFNGLAQNDYWLATIPVKNFVKGKTKFTIEMGAGGAASGAGLWLLGYSTNGTSWTGFSGYYSVQRGEKSANAHLWTTHSTITAEGYTNLRKKYIKKTFEEDTEVTKYSYKKFTFTSPVTIEDGILYLRLRTWYSGSQTSLTKPKNTSWTDLKGFEVSFAEEE